MPDIADTPQATETERTFGGSKGFRTVALAGFPLSLSSPGATISMAVVMLWGLYRIIRGDVLDDDLKRVFWSMLACYALLVVTDVLNGGGARNIETAFNYLPLLALAPFAHAIRRLAIPRTWIANAVGSTLLLAFCITMIRVFVFDETRPGGINLVSIGYGFVVAVWVAVALSLALAGHRKPWQIAAILAGCVTVLVTQSKIDLIALICGCLSVGVYWAWAQGRWKEMLAAAILASLPLALGVYFLMAERFVSFWNELSKFAQDGSTDGWSFGVRYELNISGIRAFLENPILGHGFAERMGEVYSNTTPDGPDITFLSYVHNDYVTHMVAYGSMGLVFIAAYFLLAGRLVARVADEAYRRAGFALFVMLAVYMFADVVFNMDPVTGLVTILLGTILASGSRSAAKPR